MLMCVRRELRLENVVAHYELLQISCTRPGMNSRLLSPQVLKGSKKLCLTVRSVGRIPGGYVTNHVYTWVDPHGRSVSPPPDLPEHRGATLRRSDSQRRSNMQLLQEGDEKKVRNKMVDVPGDQCHLTHPTKTLITSTSARSVQSYFRCFLET